MAELIYTIDKTLSKQNQALVLTIEEAEIDGMTYRALSQKPLTEERLKKSSPLATFLISLQKGKTHDNTVTIPYPQTFQALKLLAATGKLYFNHKQVIADLYGRAELFYRVTSSGLEGVIKTISQEFLLNTCDFICGGPPHWFIKGMSLKFLSTSLSYKDFTGIVEGRFRPISELEEEAFLDPEAPRVIFLDRDYIDPNKKDPLPILILKDRSGAFANLWMDYQIGNDKWLPFHQEHEIAVKQDRNFTTEKAWEKDLLETDYIKKIVDTTNYYCPLDKVAKSLAFLLELGWKIIDYKGNRVISHTQVKLNAESFQDSIAVKGKIHYDTFEVEIADMAGAFNRRERFVQLGSGVVGLLPNHWEQNGLNLLLEETEVVGKELRMKKSRIGTFTDFLETPEILSLDSTLNKLKEGLLSFKGIEHVSPGEGFKGQLRPYQQEGLDWLFFLYTYHFHGILADDMGLGKTVQVLAFLSRLEEQSTVLIIVPTSLIFNWRKEIERFLPDWQITIHYGPQRSNQNINFQQKTIILTSYSTLRSDYLFLSERKFTCIILDEAQVIKNSQTQTFKAVKRLQGRFRLEVTGTPVENHLEELWSHFHFLIPDLFGDESTFAAEVRASSSDSRFLQRIKRKIRPFVLRRNKDEVAKDLPEKIEQVIWLEMNDEQRQVYERYLGGVKRNLLTKVQADGSKKHRIEIFEAILRLRQICCHPLLVTAQQEDPCTESAKLNMLLQELEVVREEGRKALIYSQFTSMLHLIGKKIVERNWTYAYLDGSTVNREKVVNQFQEDPSLSFFLISLKAGGIGLNLTAADYVFIYDPWWNNAVENQAIDRAHRIGRKETVIAKRYVIAESIEEKMMKLKEIKGSLAADLLDESASTSNLSEEDLIFLLS